MGIVLLVVGVVTMIMVLSLSSWSYCPVEGKWFLLGRDATLIHQMDGSKTLCHDDGKGGTVCHDYQGGFRGLGGKPK